MAEVDSFGALLGVLLDRYGIDEVSKLLGKDKAEKPDKPMPPFIYVERTGRKEVLKVSAPNLADYIRENLHYHLVKDRPETALMFYVYDHGVYRHYDTSMMQGKIKQYIADFNPQLVQMRVVNEVYNQLSTDLDYKEQSDLNIDESIINFQNGLLHISGDDLALTEHNPDILSTIQIPCKWTGQAEPTPVFDNYLMTLTDNNKEDARLILEFMGVCISNVKGHRMKKSLWLVGDGDSGKSQILNLIQRILGVKNVASIDLKDLEGRWGTGLIYGTRLAGSGDMSYLTVSELKAFKKLTGGDLIDAEFKHVQGFQYTYNGLLWFCMNKLPKFGGDDGKWVYDRIMIVKCPNVIPKEKQDKLLLEKMYAERAGIVYKAVLALQNVIQNGYNFSESSNVIANRSEYFSRNNSVIAFFDECMEERPKVNGRRIVDSSTVSKIHDVYIQWCKSNNGKFFKDLPEFKDALCRYLHVEMNDLIYHNSNGTAFRNYTLTMDAKRQFHWLDSISGAEYERDEEDAC